jgi:hypothetical protein
MISRLSKVRSWHDILLVLLAVMVVSLLLTIVTGAAALVLYGQPSGDKVADVADVFGWLFAVAFVTAFVGAVLREHRT